jgi:hypothetical protein
LSITSVVHVGRGHGDVAQRRHAETAGAGFHERGRDLRRPGMRERSRKVEAEMTLRAADAL